MSSSSSSGKVEFNFSEKQYSNSFAVKRYNASTTFSDEGSFLQTSQSFLIDALKLAFLLNIIKIL